VVARARATRAAKGAGGEAFCVISLHSNLLLLASPTITPASLGITNAEHEVAMLAAAGLSNSLIAARRESSPNTVANLLTSAYRKLGISGRRELRTLMDPRK
jgi:DNA-binding CsgD family transcriptional regulator